MTSETGLYDGLKDFTHDKYKELQDEIIAYTTAPPEIGSWTEHIETFIVLDSGTEASLLYEAAHMALSQSHISELDNGGKCVPTIENAARGAALRARDWIEYWEPYERERLYWERLYWVRFDEDDPDTWEMEEADEEADEEPNEGDNEVDEL